MKIRKITLRNYKKFVQEKTFCFTDAEGEINEQTLLLGNNGSGKSSILQAIVMLVASAVREDFKPDTLDWSGFEYRFLQSGRMPLKIEVEITFSKEEIKATIEFVQKLKDNGGKLEVIPSSLEQITLSLDFGKHKVLTKTAKNIFQFRGYQYAKQLSKITPNKNTLFDNVGNIYWYNEQRNSYNLSNLLDSELPQIDFIRSFLASAYSYHLALKSNERTMKEGEFDFYDKLQTIYSKVFVGRSFVGSAPRFDIYEQSKAPDFFLTDGHNEYELSGMSAGERAIFPILMDFARWNINNSIVIIDELELHLHPPLQQTLVRVLSRLGNDNQFIFTTHSDSIVAMFDESQIIRLPNE